MASIHDNDGHKHVVIINPSSEPVGRVFDTHAEAMAFFDSVDEAVMACMYDENGNYVPSTS